MNGLGLQMGNNSQLPQEEELLFTDVCVDMHAHVLAGACNNQTLPICNQNRQISGSKFLPLPCVMCTKHVIVSYFPWHF